MIDPSMPIEATGRYSPEPREGITPRAVLLSTQFGAPVTWRYDVSRRNAEIQGLLGGINPQPWARWNIARRFYNPIFSRTPGTGFEGYLYSSNGTEPEKIMKQIIDLGDMTLRIIERRHSRESKFFDSLHRFLYDPNHPLSPILFEELNSQMSILVARFRAQRSMIQSKDSGAKDYRNDVVDLGKYNEDVFKPSIVIEEGEIHLVHPENPTIVISSKVKAELDRTGVADEIAQSLKYREAEVFRLLSELGRVGYPWLLGLTSHT